MQTLIQYGWNNYHHFHPAGNNLTDVARVISIKGSLFYLITHQGEKEAELTGKLLFSLSKEEQPKVGDWVRVVHYDTQTIIIEVFPRKNSLSRRTPGSEGKSQVMASNIDVAVIVQGLDKDFNLMRLERYLSQISACGIKPTIVLNKADLIIEKESYRQQINKLQRDVPVWFCSTYTGEGLEELQSGVFEPGRTCALLGSSGVGKSSLINAIMSSEVQLTRSISQSTAKGKHTTTTRDLFLTPGGCMIIDTPGMREFGIGFNDEIDDDSVFPAISKYAVHCRFADCSHTSEKGCAVMKAVDEKNLDEQVYQSYLKLIREQEIFEKSKEQKNREGKRFGKMAREAQAYRKKYKY